MGRKEGRGKWSLDELKGEREKWSLEELIGGRKGGGSGVLMS